MNQLLRFFVLPVHRPVRGLRDLIQSKQRVGYGSIVFLVLGILYTVSVQLAYSRGIGAAVQPFVDIPAEDYYAFQRFWQIPFFFLTSIVFAGTARLLASAVSGTGSFEAIFAVFCVAQTLPMFITMWLPETFLFLFSPGVDLWPVWVDVVRQVVGIVWPLVLTVLGIVLSEDLRGRRSLHAIWITLVAAIPAVGLMVVFVR